MKRLTTIFVMLAVCLLSACSGYSAIATGSSDDERHIEISKRKAILNYLAKSLSSRDFPSGHCYQFDAGLSVELQEAWWSQLDNTSLTACEPLGRQKGSSITAELVSLTVIQIDKATVSASARIGDLWQANGLYKVGAENKLIAQGLPTFWHAGNSLRKPIKVALQIEKATSKTQKLQCASWYVQVLAVKNKKNIAAVQQAIYQVGYPSMLLKQKLYYKVRVGPYTNQREVLIALRHLQPQYPDAFVVCS